MKDGSDMMVLYDGIVRVCMTASKASSCSSRLSIILIFSSDTIKQEGFPQKYTSAL